MTATGLATPGGITVTPTLTQVASITTVAGSALVDGDYFTVKYDGGTVPIQFDLSPGDGATGGMIPLLFTAGDSADLIRDNVILALNAAAPTKLTASSGGAATVAIVLDTPGAAGDTNTENVADAGFAVTGFADPTAATTYTYKLVARLADGSTTEAGTASTTAAGHATLSASNYNALSWAAVSGAASYDVYRTVGGATQGKIAAATTALVLDDTGLAGGGETAPTIDTTGLVAADGLRLGTSTTAGWVLTADANGYGSWAVGGGGVTNSAGANVLAKSDGTNLVASSVTDDGTTLTLGNAKASVAIATGALTLKGTQGTDTKVLSFQNHSGTEYGYVSVRATNSHLDVRLQNLFATTTLGVDSGNANYDIYGDATGIGLRSSATFWVTASGNAQQVHAFDLLGGGSAGTAKWGVASATPVAYRHTLAADARAATDTNVRGANADLAPGDGTGTAGSGQLALQTAYGAATGTAANTFTDRWFAESVWTDLTETTATNFSKLTFAASTAVGAEWLVTVSANDGTEYQSLTSRVRVSSVRKATGDTVSEINVVGTDLTAASSGTLTCTFTDVEGAAGVTVAANCTSSLTQTVLRISYQTTVNGPATVGAP